MEIRPSVLVACNFYGIGEDRILLSPDCKRALGVVLEGPRAGHHSESFFKVRIIYSQLKFFNGQTLEMEQSQLVALAQLSESVISDKRFFCEVPDGVLDIILELSRTVELLEEEKAAAPLSATD